MKKIIAMLLALVLVLSMAACAQMMSFVQNPISFRICEIRSWYFR